MEPEEFEKGVRKISWRRYSVVLALVGLVLFLWAFGNAEFNLWVGLGVYAVLQVWVIVRITRKLRERKASWGDDSLHRRAPELEDGLGASPAGAPLLMSLVLLYRTVRDAYRNRKGKDHPF